MKLILLFFMLLDTASAFELIAHRGVHQTYHRESLKNDTCTARRIDKPRHKFLENTLESIEEAFRLGADIVELDIHPLVNEGGELDLIVFHDWTLNCRTNASCKSGCNCSGLNACKTHAQTLGYIKKLDIGHGYTFDDGKTFPFRGKHFGQAPTFREVLQLLSRYPEKKILINQKDLFKKTVNDFIGIVSKYPESIRKRLLFPRFVPGFDQKLNELNIPETIYQGKKAKICLKEYVLKGWYTFPSSCKKLKLFIPIRETLARIHPWLAGIKVTQIVWGWPEGFIKNAHLNGAKVYASQVDSLAEYKQYKDFELDGVMTNKIELIGPSHVLEKNSRSPQQSL